MKYEDYTYTSGNTSVETQCAHDESKVVGKVANYGRITTSMDDVKAKLMTQPLSVALDAGSSIFQLYKSGVITADAGCGSSLNHAVVMVGYQDAKVAPAPAPGPEPVNPSYAGCQVDGWWHHSCGE
jgi:hypothetical protein